VPLQAVIPGKTTTGMRPHDAVTGLEYIEDAV
jgi:hypothetical protein